MTGKINFDSQNIVNEWNMVAGYYDITYRLIRYYNEATLTPCGSDDIEVLKRIIDHASCKIRFYDKKLSNMGCKDVKWLIAEVERIEKNLTKVQAMGKPGQLNVNQAKNVTQAKRDMREVHREVMWCFQCLGDFDKSRMLRGKKAAFSQFGGMDAEDGIDDYGED